MNTIKKNALIEAQVLDLTHEGQGVVKVDNFPFFVENALPGEQIEMQVLRVGKKFGYGKVNRWLSRSSDRLEDLDMAYLRTGIADFGHMTYETQLVAKQAQVQKVLRQIAHLDIQVAPCIPASSPLAYRNKAAIPTRMIDGRLETGFFRKHSHQLIPIDDFYIQNKVIDTLISDVRRLLQKFKIAAYDESSKQGIMRNIIVRRGHYTGEVMIVFVTAKAVNLDQLCTSLIDKHPDIVSIMQSIHDNQGNNIMGEHLKCLYGRDYIEDSMLGKTYQIAAKAFYQVNTPMAEQLYKTAFKFADLTESDVVVDAYSGIGTIGLSIAEQVKAVYGMEIVDAAVVNAQTNARLNGITNAHYVTGDASQVIKRLEADRVGADVIIVDPPRKGLTPEFIETSSRMQARSIVYISCNPATFARDVAFYDELGYKLEKVQPVDLFPQTHHVETVALLTRSETTKEA